MDAQCSLTFSFVTPDFWRDNLGGEVVNTTDKTIKSWFDSIIDQDRQPVLLESLVLKGLPTNYDLEITGDEGCLHLIPSHLGLINIDLDLAYMLSGVPPARLGQQRARVYRQLRSHLKNYAESCSYDYVVIDCPPNFNIVTKNAIVASDEILIPARPDYLSTLGIDFLLRSLDQLVSEFNEDSSLEKINPEILGVIFTMIQIMKGEPIRAQRQYMNPELMPVPVFSNTIRDNKTIFADAPEGGIPVVLKGTGNREPYRTIVRELELLTSEFENRSGE